MCANLKSQDQGGTSRNIYLQPVLPTVPLHGRSEVLAAVVDTIVSPKAFLVTVHDDAVLPRCFDTNAVVGVRLVWVDFKSAGRQANAVFPHRLTVEDEKQSGSLEHDHLVALMLEGHESLPRKRL